MTPDVADFFQFVYERQAVWFNRFIRKIPAPWTDDVILQQYKFCNVYRELDGGTLAISRYLKQRDILPEQKLFNIIAYRFFNRRDTFENLFGGLLCPEKFDFKAMEKRLDQRKKEGSLFSNAYLIASAPYGKYRPKDKHIQILLMLDDIRLHLSEIINELRQHTPQEGLKIIENNIRLAGPFLSGQILLDITYCGDIVTYTSDDFLIVGPGAHWGLNLLAGRTLSKGEADIACRKLYQMQQGEFEKLKANTGKDWLKICWDNREYPNYPYLSLHDVQNSLCEFRKYWRLKCGEKAKKRYFRKAYLADF